MAHFEIVEHEAQQLVKATVDNETIRAEAGALCYYHGDIEMSPEQPSVGGILKRVLLGHAVSRPTYSGVGVVYFGPPRFGEYVVIQLDDEEWILDEGAYVCSDVGVEVGGRRSQARLQTSVRGTGKVVVKAPGKVQTIRLRGERMAVGGDLVVARSATVDCSVRRAGRSRVGSMLWGEGLLNVYQGHGTVLLAPVPNLHQSVVESVQAASKPAQLQPGAARRRTPLGCVIAAVLVACALSVAAILAILAATSPPS
jgi:uncharacterized protein (AIM24 family)